jgi:hypothetical protein
MLAKMHAASRYRNRINCSSENIGPCDAARRCNDMKFAGGGDVREVWHLRNKVNKVKDNQITQSVSINAKASNIKTKIKCNPESVHRREKWRP